MRVLFFTDGPESPGSRFRCLQLFPHLEARGIQCEVRFAYDTRYNDLFEHSWAPAYKLWGRLKRAGRMLSATGFDVLFLHKTALAVTGLPERLRAFRGTPMVFDFDDAIYLGPGGLIDRRRRKAFEHVVSVADHVIAGNAHLAAMTRRRDVTIIPSVVDSDRYVPAPARLKGDELVVGWIGTASNFPSLRRALPSLLKEVEQLPRARLRIVSNGTLGEYTSHPRVEQWRWNEVGEVRALQSFDVGLMPLEDTELTRGKCGFKMIQYMAVGVPVLASAVGANLEIFKGSDAGLLVGEKDDWGACLQRLLDSQVRFEAMGTAGRRHVVEHYSIHAVIDDYVRVLRAAQARHAPFSPSP